MYSKKKKKKKNPPPPKKRSLVQKYSATFLDTLLAPTLETIRMVDKKDALLDSFVQRERIFLLVDRLLRASHCLKRSSKSFVVVHPTVKHDGIWLPDALQFLLLQL